MANKDGLGKKINGNGFKKLGSTAFIYSGGGESTTVYGPDMWEFHRSSAITV
jgi:hypothetical protein